MNSTQKIKWHTAAALVIANMVGTGVFTSLGFQVMEIHNTWSIVLLWSFGGLLALIGALVYAELGVYFKKSGGDYIFLSKTIHPMAGYLYAWVSLMVGFSAPIAIAGMAMMAYWEPLMGQNLGMVSAISAILILSLFHSFSLGQSGKVQNTLTVIKILFALSLIVLGFSLSADVEGAGFDWTAGWIEEIPKSAFAISLVFVFYAYTGWNSAAYIVEEIDQPQKSLPRALILATLTVMLLYILLQLVFLKHSPIQQLAGRVEVATIAFGNLFGVQGIFWVSVLIGVQLLGTISGYIWVGPRVTQAMAKDYKFWSPLEKTNSKGIPVRAIWFNTAISLILVFTGSFESILLYAGLVMQLMGTLTVAASIKVKPKDGFKSPFKPWLQIAYIFFSLWVMGFMVYDRPKESLLGLGIVFLGAVLYYFDKEKASLKDV